MKRAGSGALCKCLCWSALLLAGGGRGACGQDAAPSKDQPAPPEQVVLQTADGVTLQATYYPGPVSKQTPPIVMLHDERSTRSVYDALARRLQAAGCAVLAADLRGFGGSTTADDGRRLDGARLAPAEYGNMVRHDLEAMRRYLIARNNAGEVNLAKLGVLAAGMSAPVALVWAYHDWTAPPLSTGKQGQDIHALAMLSPAFRAGSVRSEAALASGSTLRSVAMLVAVGGGKPSRSLTDSQRVYDALTRVHPGARSGSTRGSDALYLRRYDTSLQGGALLGANLGVEDDLVSFFDAKLVKPSIDWTQRKRAFD